METGLLNKLLNGGDPIARLPFYKAGKLHFQNHRVNDWGGYLALPNDFVNRDRSRRQTRGDRVAGGVEPVFLVAGEPFEQDGRV